MRRADANIQIPLSEITMSQIIPFESSSLPAFISQAFQITNDLLVSGNGGYPTVSIKGKVFTLKRGDEKTLITKPDAPDEPASSLEVVILKAGPAGDKLSKVFYEGGFVEGSDDKPACYSNDGVAPSINAQKPQAKTCAACPHNVWGSKISDSGSKTKSCVDSKRLAIAPAGQINDPMLLRVPAASLKALTAFGQQLAKRGVPYQAVVAKIGFDYTVAHPALTFKPVGFVDQGTLTEIQEMIDSDLVQRITGLTEEARNEDDGGFSATPVPDHVKKAESKPAAKPKAATKPAPVDDDEDPAPKVEVKVEAKVEDAPVEEAPKAKKAAAPAVTEIASDLDEALDDFDFDD